MPTAGHPLTRHAISTDTELLLADGGAGVTGKYQEPWWTAKLGAVYCKYRQGTEDPQAFNEARKVIGNQQLLTPNYDEDTMAGLEPEQQFEPRFKKLFRHLDGKIPQ